MKLANKFFLVIILLLTFISGNRIALAQDQQPTQPVYVVQSGDTLWDIARRFGVTIDDLMRVNNIVDAGLLKAGDEIIIPGLDGVQGRLITRPLTFGESLIGLSRYYDLQVDVMSRLNRITSPSEIYVGLELILPEEVSTDDPESTRLKKRTMMESNQSVLEFAVLQTSNPWNVAFDNFYPNPAFVAPGEVLFISGSRTIGDSDYSNGLIPEIENITISQVPWVQGKTAKVILQTDKSTEVQATFFKKTLSFFPEPNGDGSRVALQGIHALTDEGLYPLVLSVNLPDGSVWSFSQNIPVVSGNYPFDPVLIVDPATIDPQVTQPENEQWSALAQPVTNSKLWDGSFTNPVESIFIDCWTSTFGNRRSYNDSGYLYFHSGLDFCGAVGNSIFAPAAGEVIFAGPMTVRGNATMINHGWGVYSAYMHQSEILVQVGDFVDVGQLIGKVGGTGRVNGPHLHWEVWVGGVQVNPADWLLNVFP